MARKARCTIRVKELDRVFQRGDEVSVLVARLCVLFEDLQLEVRAIVEPSIEGLDKRHLSDAHRRLYFLRRSLVTLTEFGSALKCLNGLASFKALKSKVPASGGRAWKAWDDAVRFFEEKSYHARLKSVRNLAGGHFSARAAETAVENLVSGLTGTIERNLSGAGSHSSFKLHFVGDISLTACVAALGDVKQIEDREKRAWELCVDIGNEGYRKATTAMRTLLQNYLWDRFG